ncbi:alpha/beta hydrolase family protein [Halioxenophilus sp. WMMB6]|uniref:alpha/beta hydrolase family protein n=1 Tax=Halioxenophilus sp. WMMB6 TaxID=3073815 RepID=UPI00295EF30B|nr:prolyl oligopeptidase family serine peptidase [Halioxenophilus sp. WMMB6]
MPISQQPSNTHPTFHSHIHHFPKRNRVAQWTIGIWLLMACFCSAAYAAELEAFGQLPGVKSFSISPDGQRYTWIANQEGEEPVLMVYDAIHKTLIGGLRLAGDAKARYVYFATNDFIILSASDTLHIRGYLGRLEYSGAYAYHIPSKEIHQLFDKTKGLYPAQSGLGNIIGINTEQSYAYMPAYGDSSPPTKNLYRVNLKSGRGKLIARGRTDTLDWFVTDSGEILAREDFDGDGEEHSFYSYLNGRPEKVFSYQSKLPNISVQAVSADERGLLFIYDDDSSSSVQQLSLVDGTISAPLFESSDKEIARIITDNNRKLLAIKYSGLLPDYEFAKEGMTKTFNSILASFPASSVDLIETDAGAKKMLIQVGGNYLPDAYLIYDSEANRLNYITRGYPTLEEKDLGEVIGFRYTARDGLKIPAVLTWPVNSSNAQGRKNQPLIVLPHGGPASYDRVQFDWLSQYLANLGYVVLQPNFRGSTGFGAEFRNAGIGRWGREMQDDVTDGVNYLIERGIADKDRVCIAGASYGGYSALIGGAFTPDLYRCVISINGVTNIRKEISNDLINSGHDEILTNHWETEFGEGKEAKQNMDAVSPIYFADQFRAPTLIIYSKDDTVVQPSQSIDMHKALSKANKNSTLFALKGEDHWLSTGETRTETLQLMTQFLTEYNPVTTTDKIGAK